ncbi:MAG TPA: hypothetical protein ENN13_02300 [Candidatus Altiarchaeales archaeon]|nr:hypothetical protein [Candidatus Altiarchaeales archaeon]
MTCSFLKRWWILAFFLVILIGNSLMIVKYHSEPASRHYFFGLEGLLDCKSVSTVFMAIAYLTALTVFSSFLFGGKIRALLGRNGDKKRLDLSLAVIAVLVVLSATSYFYVTRSACNYNYVKEWDTYHYILGAKYFNELGYVRLYECTVLANEELSGPIRSNPQVRDLSTYRYVSYNFITENSVCKDYFSENRWSEFKNDVNVFFRIKRSMWPGVLQDHGYHGTPVHTLFAKKLANSFELSYENMLYASLLDIALLFIMFYFVSKSFGWKTGFLFTILFCLNYPSRFLHIGGSFLRYFWMSALVVGLCMLNERRFRVSGVLLSLSSMLLVFPVVFTLGLGVKGIFGFLKTRTIPASYRVFFSYFTLTCVILAVVSSLAGHGFSDWLEFKDQMDLNAYRLSHHRIGFKYVFMPNDTVSQSVKLASFEEKQFAYYSSLALILVLAVLISTRVDDVDASILLGLTVFFTYFVTVRYYYMVLALLIILWRKKLDGRGGVCFTILLFLMMGFMFHTDKMLFQDMIFPHNSSAENQGFIYNTVATYLISMYLMLAIAYLVFDVGLLNRKIFLEKISF